MNKKERTLWHGYRAAWEKAEYLQSLCDEPTLLFGVIYDLLQGRWLVNCVDANQWVTERFRGGHRSYYAEVWRQQ